MDWQTVGAVGELLGAMVVIASLVYLARSIRSNTRATRQRRARSLLRQIDRFLERLAFEPLGTEIWIRGHREPDLLAEEEALRFSSMLILLVRSMEEHFYYQRDGSVDAWTFDSLRSPLHDIMASPGFAHWWERHRQWFGTDFQAHIDALLERRDPAERCVPIEIDDGSGRRSGVDRVN